MFKSKSEEEKAYESIKKSLMDNYDDPNGEDEDDLMRETDETFEQQYGIEYGITQYK